MTYLNITDGTKVAQIDLGDFDHDDMWRALEETHPDLYEWVDDGAVVDISEDYLGSDSEICSLQDLQSFLGPDMDEDTKVCKIVSQGNSMSVTVTEMARHIGVGRGDLVEVTIRRVR